MSAENDPFSQDATQSDGHSKSRDVVRRRKRRPGRPLHELTPASIVDIWDVVKLTSLSRATIYRKMGSGTFPSNRQLNANRAGWRLADVLMWLDNPR